jgi:putative FmdB family regulatory protein
MPLYPYKCLDCGSEFEELYTSFSKAEAEEPEVKCPKCGSRRKTRQVSTSTSFQLKGGGWAKTKYEKRGK